jgi:hypothetical protein
MPPHTPRIVRFASTEQLCEREQRFIDEHDLENF